MGVELQRAAQPKVFSYNIAFDNSGNVGYDHGLTEESSDEIDLLINR